MLFPEGHIKTVKIITQAEMLFESQDNLQLSLYAANHG